MDKNDYYGGSSASLNLNQMFERTFRTGTECPEPPLSELSLNDAPHAPSALLLSSGFRNGETPSSSLGASRDYNIDLEKCESDIKKNRFNDFT